MRYVLLAALIVIMPSTAAAQEKPASPPCESVAAARELDFWVGSWSMRVAGDEYGVNRIERIADGCALMERFETKTVHGGDISYYDPLLGLWRQTVAFSNGSVADFTGRRLENGTMQFEGMLRNAATGYREFRRVSFTPRPNGEVHQVIAALRNGRDWVVIYDAIYVKK